MPDKLKALLCNKFVTVKKWSDCIFTLSCLVIVLVILQQKINNKTEIIQSLLLFVIIRVVVIFTKTAQLHNSTNKDWYQNMGHVVL